MGVHTCIPCCTCQVLAISVRDVDTVGINETLCKTKIDNKYQILSCFLITYEEIIRLDISMYYTVLMHHVNSLHHLQPNVYACSEVELPSALGEEVFQTLA